MATRKAKQEKDLYRLAYDAATLPFYGVGAERFFKLGEYEYEVDAQGVSLNIKASAKPKHEYPPEPIAQVRVEIDYGYDEEDGVCFTEISNNASHRNHLWLTFGFTWEWDDDQDQDIPVFQWDYYPTKAYQTKLKEQAKLAEQQRKEEEALMNAPVSRWSVLFEERG